LRRPCLIFRSCGVLLKKYYFFGDKNGNFLDEAVFLFVKNLFFGDEMEISLTVDEAESVNHFFVEKKK